MEQEHVNIDKEKNAHQKSQYFEQNNSSQFFMPVQKKESFFNAPSKNENNQVEGNITHIPSKINSDATSVFHYDFSNVLINRNSEKAKEINALAFTQGNEISFSPGQYNPETLQGRELLGHELTHVVQQQQGRVSPTLQTKGMPINNEKGLEDEADRMGKALSENTLPDTTTNAANELITKSTDYNIVQRKQDVAQLQGAVAGAIEAGDWIAAGALGYQITNDAVKSASGDVSYTFDEMEGVLLPGGGSDVVTYKQHHTSSSIQEYTHKVAIWFGTSGWQKMGIKFGITFLYDGFALGNISLSIIDTYDWPGWGGNVNMNITPRSLAAGGIASVRLTANMGTNNSWFVPEETGFITFILSGDGVIKVADYDGPYWKFG